MSVRSGKETNRTPMELYKGYRVIKVTKIKYHRCLWDNSRFDKNWIDSKEVHFDFCKEGNEKLPSQDYNVQAKNVEGCKEAIDKFLNGDNKGNGDIYYTHAEFQKYVKSPNNKCDYGYGYDSLMKVMREHQKADKRMKWFLEERLHDANFHTAANYLSDCDYDGFEQFVAKDCRFNEKFEIYTKTMRKAIKDPQNLVDGLKMAIDAYFASKGIKDTSVEVRFCEEW